MARKDKKSKADDKQSKDEETSGKKVRGQQSDAKTAGDEWKREQKAAQMPEIFGAVIGVHKAHEDEEGGDDWTGWPTRRPLPPWFEQLSPEHLDVSPEESAELGINTFFDKTDDWDEPEDTAVFRVVLDHLDIAEIQKTFGKDFDMDDISDLKKRFGRDVGDVGASDLGGPL